MAGSGRLRRPGPVQAIDRMKKDIVAMRGVVSAVKKSIGEAQALL